MTQDLTHFADTLEHLQQMKCADLPGLSAGIPASAGTVLVYRALFAALFKGEYAITGLGNHVESRGEWREPTRTVIPGTERAAHQLRRVLEHDEKLDRFQTRNSEPDLIIVEWRGGRPSPELSELMLATYAEVADESDADSIREAELAAIRILRETIAPTRPDVSPFRALETH